MEGYHIKVYTGGKISIPLELRNEMHIEDGDELLVTLENNKIIISTYDLLLTKTQDLVKKNIKQRQLTQELKNLRTSEANALKGSVKLSSSRFKKVVFSEFRQQEAFEQLHPKLF